MNGTSGRTIQVELPASGLEAIETYRGRMLELIGVELTESQVAAMLIHFGKQVQMGRLQGDAVLAVSAPAEPARLPARNLPSPAPRGKRRIKEIAARPQRATSPREGARTCACGCGGKLKSRSARWLVGHNPKRGRLAGGKSGESAAEVVWDGRGPLTPPWNQDRHGA